MSQSVLKRLPAPADARIRYGDDPAQFADLRLPIIDGPWPGIVAIHGGYWRSAYTLDSMSHLSAALTAIGIATWNIEYRRIGVSGGGWPGTFLDVMAAARIFFSYAPRLGVDPARIAVLGHSAGGHLASWLASVRRAPTDSPIAGPQLPYIAAIPIAGIFDLEKGIAEGIGNGAIPRFLGGDPATIQARYVAASPISLVPSTVPHMLIHGTEDAIVPIAQSRNYETVARSAGGIVDLRLIPGADHFDVIDPMAPHWPTVLSAIASVFRAPRESIAIARQ